MAKRRGFFAEMQHQSRMAEQRRRQHERASAQAAARAVREQQRADREYARLQQQYERRTAALDAQAERDRRRAYEDRRRAEVESLNADLAEKADQIDSLLAATLGVDDYVDLASLRQTIQNPAFDRPDLQTPTPRPREIRAPAAPVYHEPPQPTGLAASFGGKKKYAAAVAANRATYEQAYRTWQSWMSDHANRTAQANREYEQRETKRLHDLRLAQAEHEQLCLDQRKAVLEANVRLERLIVALQERQAWAVEEYIAIVLANSVYPESFPVEHEFEFEAADQELRLKVTVPNPADLPGEKSFRYVKATDSIASTPLTAKARKERYAKAVWEVALRSAHEIFEADRDGVVQTIALTVGTAGVDPATGRATEPVLVELATDRAAFAQLDLARVEPRETLDHLRAGLSKNPHDLVPVAHSRGVRG